MTTVTLDAHEPLGVKTPKKAVLASWIGSALEDYDLVIQSADCFVDAQGVMYLTDNNAGLYVLQFEGA